MSQEVEEVNLHATRQSVPEVQVVDSSFCRPGANEMYDRFQSFLNGGPRTVIPDKELLQSSVSGSAKHSDGRHGDVHLRSGAEGADGRGGASAYADQFPAGTRVEIQGLRSKPELNGQVGSVLLFDLASGRYEVCLEDGQSKRVRHVNLRPICEHGSQDEHAVETHQLESGMLVQVCDFPKESQLSSHEGTLTEYDPVTEKWQVFMSNGCVSWVEPYLIRPLLGLGPQDGGGGIPEIPKPIPPATASAGKGLQSGAHVKVVGLKSRSDVNGQHGTLVNFVDADGRWQVRMSDGSGKSIMPGHLELCAATLEPLAISSAELAPGARVRIRGLAIRPDLDGEQGLLTSFDRMACRWVVEVQGAEIKLREENLELVQAAPDISSNKSQVSLRFEDSATGDELLTLCMNRRNCLSVADIAVAIRRLGHCTDHKIARTDDRLSVLIGQLRTLLEQQASPQDIAEVLQACRESDLYDLPLFDVLAQCTQNQVHQFRTQEIVQILFGFAFVGHAPVALFDAFAIQILGVHIPHLCAAEALQVAEAFAIVRLRHFEMLDELAKRAAVRLSDVVDEDLARGVLAFAGLEVLCGDLLIAVSQEVALRSTAGDLTLHQVANLAQALMKAAALQGGVTAVESALRGLEKVASGLISDVNLGSLESVYIAKLYDSFPALRQKLQSLVSVQVQQVVTLIRASDEQALGADAMHTLLEKFRSRTLGAIGMRRLLTELGIGCCEPGFRQRAVNRLCWAASYVEDWNVCTVLHRQFACGEYHFTSQPWGQAVEGSFVCHGDEQRLNAEVEFGDNHGNRLLEDMLGNGLLKSTELGALYALLSKVFGRCKSLCSSSGLETLDWKQIRGSIQVLLTEGPELSGFLALRQLQLMMPKLVISLAIAGEEQAEELLPMQESDTCKEEVMDWEFADEEVMDVTEELDAEVVD